MIKTISLEVYYNQHNFNGYQDLMGLKVITNEGEGTIIGFFIHGWFVIDNSADDTRTILRRIEEINVKAITHKTFKDLKIGQRFEFVRKSDVCGGLYNGKGTKKSDCTYTMDGTSYVTRGIGNVNLEINEIAS